MKKLCILDIVISSNESKINRFSSDERAWCWTHDPKEFFEQTIIQTIKHGCDSIMIWGCVSIYGPSLIHRVERRFNHQSYQQILEEQF